MPNKEIELGWEVLDRLPRGYDGALMASAIRTRIAEAILAERNACAKAVISRGMETKNGEWHGNNHAAASFAECILARD